MCVYVCVYVCVCMCVCMCVCDACSVHGICSMCVSAYLVCASHRANQTFETMKKVATSELAVAKMKIKMTVQITSL